MTESNKGPRCPVCSAAAARKAQNEAFPFCSPRCRTIDLGSWIDERYRVPTDDPEGAFVPDESSEILH